MQWQRQLHASERAHAVYIGAHTQTLSPSLWNIHLWFFSIFPFFPFFGNTLVTSSLLITLARQSDYYLHVGNRRRACCQRGRRWVGQAGQEARNGGEALERVFFSTEKLYRGQEPTCDPPHPFGLHS
jgi:hypothetical protein